MDWIKAALAVVARFFLSIGFLRSAAQQVMDWKGSEKELMNVIADWQTYTVDSQMLQILFSFFAIWAPLLLLIGTFLEVLGGVLLLFGVKERAGAFLLALVLLPQTILVQHFWFTESSIHDARFAFFLRDLAIFGGLLVVLLRGTQEKAEPSYSHRDSDFE